MKICWDNLENVFYKKSSNLFYKKLSSNIYRSFVFVDKCKYCGEEFLGDVISSREFCSRKCLYSFRQNSGFSPKKWSKEDLSFLKRKAHKFTLKGLSSILGRSESAVKYKCFELKVHTNDVHQPTFDIHYFDVIDSADKAYFLGLLGADGCNYTKRNQVALSLKEEDKYILEKFSKYLKSNVNLLFIKKQKPTWSNQYVLYAHNKYFSETLLKKGIIPKKTLEYKFPNFIPEDLLNHFIRGFFDGDGSISKKSKCFSYRIDFVGTELFTKGLQVKLDKLGFCSSLYKKPIGRGRTVQLYCLSIIGGRKSQLKFLKWMYKNSFKSKLRLDRKYQRYLDMKKGKKV